MNVLLFCMWLGASGRGGLSAVEMKIVTGAVQEWHNEVVRELRAVRVRMKSGIASAPADLSESLRQRIQKTEIDCEHTEQLMLAAAIEKKADDSRAEDARLADAVANIAEYFKGFGGTASETDRANIAHMLGVVFSGQASTAILDACGNL